MFTYNIDKGNGEVEQVTGESADVLIEHLKKGGYTKVMLSTDTYPFFDQGNLKMFRGTAHCVNEILNLKDKINFTVYAIND